jgi:hypothetical protein
MLDLGSCKEVAESSTPGTMGHRLRPNILDMVGSLQQQIAREPYTPYLIWSHHLGLKRRGHQSKRNQTRE